MAGRQLGEGNAGQIDAGLFFGLAFGGIDERLAGINSPTGDVPGVGVDAALGRVLAAKQEFVVLADNYDRGFRG
jgi:hypothetical protein